MLITRIILGIVFLLAGWLIVLGNYWVHNSALTKDIVEKAYFESLEMDVNSGNNLESMYRTMYSFAAMPFYPLIEWGEVALADEQFDGKYPNNLPNHLKTGIQAIYTFSSGHSAENKWFTKSDSEVDRYVKNEVNFYYEKYRKWMTKTPEEKKKPDFYVIRDFVFKRDTLYGKDPVILLIMKKSFEQTDFRAVALALDFDFFVKRLSEGLSIYAPTFLETHFGNALFDQISGVEITYNDEMIFRWGQLDTTITITQNANECKNVANEDEEFYSYTVELKRAEACLFGYIPDIKMEYGSYVPHNGWLADSIMKYTSGLKRGLTRISVIAGILFTIAIVLLFNVWKRSNT
ncbi:MAG: hypothetical protein P9X24_10515 [Candidatus Hatepunaea meridiana]|nr:hypothetical protein [Candidatus Hatepunaea meridiana]